MKRIDVVAVGLTMSDRLLIGAFLDLIALTDGHVFRLCDYPDAAIVIFNPDDSHAVALLRAPQRGVAYIQYGTSLENFGPDVWRLGAPVRLGPLREIMISIVERRREWAVGGFVQAASASASASAHTSLMPKSAVQPVPAHRKLEQVLGVLECVMNSRMPHFFTGVAGVAIEVFPDTKAVYIRCDAGLSSWQQALVNTSQPLAAFSRIGAKPIAEIAPISIAQFRWELARHLSAGMLLPGIAAKQVFALTRWPDFGSMNGAAFDLRIVALIATRPASIATMLKTVPYTREGVIALLNGCALVGCMREAPEDLLHSVEAQMASAVANAGRTTPVVYANSLSVKLSSVPSGVTPTPQRGFSGMLSKLRAALSFVSRDTP